jgi:hypothetical protein
VQGAVPSVCYTAQPAASSVTRTLNAGLWAECGQVDGHDAADGVDGGHALTACVHTHTHTHKPGERGEVWCGEECGMQGELV